MENATPSWTATRRRDLLDELQRLDKQLEWVDDRIARFRRTYFALINGKLVAMVSDPSERVGLEERELGLFKERDLVIAPRSEVLRQLAELGKETR